MTIRIITKYDAAGRQLETAIRLYFEGTDDVSVCVLLHSSWSILKDLLKDKKLKSTRDWIAEEYEAQTKGNATEVFGLLNHDWNFFKHANHDPYKALHFNSESLQKALIFAIDDLLQISRPSIIINIYRYWCCAKDPLPANVRLTAEALPFAHKANELFPDLHLKNEQEQKLLGMKALHEALTSMRFTNNSSH